MALEVYNNNFKKRGNKQTKKTLFSQGKKVFLADGSEEFTVYHSHAPVLLR